MRTATDGSIPEWSRSDDRRHTPPPAASRARRRWPVGSIRLVLGLAVLAAEPATAVVCTVPSGPHPTIQAAVDDLSCTEIELAAQTFAESFVVGRDLIVRGDSTPTSIVEGQVEILGNGVAVGLEDFSIDASTPAVAGCFPVALEVGDGAVVATTGMSVVNGRGTACPIFANGFESGDTSGWSNVVP